MVQDSDMPPMPIDRSDDERFDDEVEVSHRRPLWQRIAKWAAIVVVALIVLVGALLLGLNTGPGKRFIVSQIEGL